MSDIIELYIKECAVHRTEPYYGFVKGAQQGRIDCDLDFIPADDISRMAFAMNVKNSRIIAPHTTGSSKKTSSLLSGSKPTAPKIGSTSLTFLRLCRGVHRDKQHPPVNSSKIESYRKLLSTYGARSSMYCCDDGSVVAYKKGNEHVSDGAGTEHVLSPNTLSTHSREPYLSLPQMSKGVTQKLTSGLVCAIKMNSLNLQEIHLVNINLDTDCVKKLCSALHFCQSLRVLNLSKNPKIGDAGALALSNNGCLAAMTCLRKLSLKMCDLTRSSGRAISGIVASNKEKEFNRNFRTSLRGKERNYLNSESNNAGITHIDLSHNYICGEAVAELMKALEAGDVSVESVNLRQNILSRKDINIVVSTFSKIHRSTPQKRNFTPRSHFSPISFIDVSDNIGLEECSLEQMLDSEDIEAVGEGVLVVRNKQIGSRILSDFNTINNVDPQEARSPAVNIRRSISAPSRQSINSSICGPNADKSQKLNDAHQMENLKSQGHQINTLNGQCQHHYYPHPSFLCFPTYSHSPCLPEGGPLGIHMPSHHYDPCRYNQPLHNPYCQYEGQNELHKPDDPYLKNGEEKEHDKEDCINIETNDPGNVNKETYFKFFEDVLARIEIGENEKAIAIERLRNEVSAYDQRFNSISKMISQHSEILSKVQVAEKRRAVNERKNAARSLTPVVNTQSIEKEEPKSDQELMLSNLAFDMANLITRGLDKIEEEMGTKKDSNLIKLKPTQLGTLSSIGSISARRDSSMEKGIEVRSLKDEVTSRLEQLGW